MIRLTIYVNDRFGYSFVSFWPCTFLTAVGTRSERLGPDPVVRFRSNFVLRATDARLGNFARDTLSFLRSFARLFSFLLGSFLPAEIFTLASVPGREPARNANYPLSRSGYTSTRVTFLRVYEKSNVKSSRYMNTSILLKKKNRLKRLSVWMTSLRLLW